MMDLRRTLDEVRAVFESRGIACAAIARCAPAAWRRPCNTVDLGLVGACREMFDRPSILKDVRG